MGLRHLGLPAELFHNASEQLFEDQSERYVPPARPYAFREFLVKSAAETPSVAGRWRALSRKHVKALLQTEGDLKVVVCRGLH